MKLSGPAQSHRIYRQTARAAATAATGERIVAAFLTRLRTQWFDEITLDAVARDADTTVQTVLRRFGGKEQLLEAAADRAGEEIRRRRSVTPGDVARAVDVLAHDYEAIGDMVLRVLAQEDRHAALKRVADRGRVSHRAWLSEVFAPWLERLPPAAHTASLDALVVATDLYVWKLARRDMGRSVNAFKSIVKRLIYAALPGVETTLKEQRS